MSYSWAQIPERGLAESHSTAGQPISCPLCGAIDYTISVSQRGEVRALQECRGCGVGFMFPQPSPDEIAAHCRGRNPVDAARLEQQVERQRQRVFAQVANYIHCRRRSGSILDVGCATGSFLSRFFRHSQWQVSAVELSARTTGRAAQNGIDVRAGDVRTAQFGEDSFDVITVLDAFQYFLSPITELSEIQRILKPDGLLLLDLPWADNWHRRRSSARDSLLGEVETPLLEGSDPLFYYTPKSISLLMKRCEFRIQAVIPLVGNQHDQRVRDLTWQGYSAISKMLFFLSRSRIFLGPRLLAVAVKEIRSSTT